MDRNEAIEIIRKNWPRDIIYSEALCTLIPELKESEDEKIRKELLNAFQESEDSLYMVLTPHRRESFISWIEKQGEQKSTDKVEPKFKVGDWIINPKTRNVLQIKNILLCGNKGNYEFDNSSMPIGSVDEHYKQWTIQDAKDGNVLYMDNGLSTCTFIYETINNGIIQKYASYNKFGFEGRHYLVLNDGYVCPATEEQRDLLFKKMKEAGYEWDAEKKELKKIKQNNIIEIPFGAKDSELVEETITIPTGFHAEIEDNKVIIKQGEKKSTEWSEEDEKMLERIISDYEAWCKEITLSPDYVHKLNWLKSLKNRVQPPQFKQDWSEEDKKMIGRIREIIERYAFSQSAVDVNGDLCEREFIEPDEWLKSLRPQNTWKPSDEMLEALYRVTPENVMEKSEDEMLLDKLYQGLKYGKVLSEK